MLNFKASIKNRWVICLAALVGLLLAIEGRAAAPWLDGDADARRIVYLDGSDLQADVTEAELQLRFSAEDLPLAASDGRDLRAYWGRDGSPLAFLVEYYQPGEGIVMTVQAPSLSASAVETLHFYYGGETAGASAAAISPTASTAEAPATDALRITGGAAFGQPIFSPGWVSAKPTASAAIHPALVPGYIRPALRVEGPEVIELPLRPERQTSEEGWTIECLILDDQPPEAGSLRGGAILSAWAGDVSIEEPVVNFGMVDQMMHTDSRSGAQGGWFGAVNSANDTPRNEWVAFSAVYDASEGRTRTYRNGEFITKGRGPSAAMTLERLYLGSWNRPVWLWKGKIDQVVVTPRAMSDDEALVRGRSQTMDPRLVVVGPKELKGELNQNQSLAAPQLIAPTGLIRRYSQPAYRWTIVPGAGQYRLTVWKEGDEEHPVLDETMARTREDREAHYEPGATYCWKVEALAEVEDGVEGLSAVSAIGRFEIPNDPPVDVEPLTPPTLSVKNYMRPVERYTIGERGPVGHRVKAAVEHWALRFPQDNPDMTRVLREQWRSDTGIHAWWGESYGKFMTGAVLVYEMTRDT